MASKKFAKAQEEAKKYVDQHNLERFVTQMMNGMIQSKPADPRIYMIRFIAERVPLALMEAHGIYVEGLPPTSPGGGGSPSPKKSLQQAASSGAAEAGQELAPPPSKEPEVRQLFKEDEQKATTTAAAAPAAATTLSEPAAADVDTAAWASASDWEQLVALVEEGRSLPPPGATATVGGPKWLAGVMLADEEDVTVNRLTWLSERQGPYLFQVDSDGANLAMALTVRAGKAGKWNAWLFDRGICSEDAKDGAGATVQDHALRVGQERQRAAEEAASLQALQTWEGVAGDLEAGGKTLSRIWAQQPPAARARDTVGSVTWLAGVLAQGGAEAVLSRLELLSLSVDNSEALIGQADGGGTNLAMGLAGRLGEGPWLDWLFDRGICLKAATDGAGKTAADYRPTTGEDVQSLLRKSITGAID